MTNATRYKIGAETAKLFDREVDNADHDKVLVSLFRDEGVLSSLLAELHGAKPLSQPSQASMPVVRCRTSPVRERNLEFSEAVDLAGVAPRFSSESPIRLKKKAIEVLMNFSSSGSVKNSRLVGFVDFGVRYEVLYFAYVSEMVPFGVVINGKFSRAPELSETSYSWSCESESFSSLFEVKAVWPSAGNLIRQLNLFKSSSAEGFGNNPDFIVVGPDDSVADLVHAHGCRLVTFDANCENFKLMPSPAVQRSYFGERTLDSGSGQVF